VGGLPNITDNRQHSLGRDTHTPALNAGAPAQEPSAFVNKRTSWV
jgi:hypothetical protein